MMVRHTLDQKYLQGRNMKNALALLGSIERIASPRTKLHRMVRRAFLPGFAVERDATLIARAWKWYMGIATCAAITGLFLAGGPSAIFWRVIAVVVDTLHRILNRGAWSHVSIECLKRIKPLWTYGYSTASVVWVILDGRIKAPILHGSPCTVFRGIAHAMLRIRVPYVPVKERAAAAFRMVVAQAGQTKRRGEIPTGALAIIEPSLRSISMRKGKDSQLIIGLPYLITWVFQFRATTHLSLQLEKCYFNYIIYLSRNKALNGC
jgi:hypothetical protein